jgi:uncharacterized membrane protein YgcG
VEVNIMRLDYFCLRVIVASFASLVFLSIPAIRTSAIEERELDNSVLRFSCDNEGATRAFAAYSVTLKLSNPIDRFIVDRTISQSLDGTVVKVDDGTVFVKALTGSTGFQPRSFNRYSLSGFARTASLTSTGLIRIDPVTTSCQPQPGSAGSGGGGSGGSGGGGGSCTTGYCGASSKIVDPKLIADRGVLNFDPAPMLQTSAQVLASESPKIGSWQGKPWQGESVN